MERKIKAVSNPLLIKVMLARCDYQRGNKQQAVNSVTDINKENKILNNTATEEVVSNSKEAIADSIVSSMPSNCSEDYLMETGFMVPDFDYDTIVDEVKARVLSLEEDPSVTITIVDEVKARVLSLEEDPSVTITITESKCNGVDNASIITVNCKEKGLSAKAEAFKDGTLAIGFAESKENSSNTTFIVKYKDDVVAAPMVVAMNTDLKNDVPTDVIEVEYKEIPEGATAEVKIDSPDTTTTAVAIITEPEKDTSDNTVNVESKEEISSADRMRGVEDKTRDGIIDFGDAFGIKIDTTNMGAADVNYSKAGTPVMQSTNPTGQSNPVLAMEFNDGTIVGNYANPLFNMPGFNQINPAILMQEALQLQNETVKTPNVYEVEAMQTNTPLAVPTEQPIVQKIVQKKEKAKEDNLTLDVGEMTIEQIPPTVKQAPEHIQKLENPTVVAKALDNGFDNSAIISKYPHLKLIQDVANSLGHSIGFVEVGNDGIPNGLILSAIWTNGQNNPGKNFCIDTGVIIDGGMKFTPQPFPGDNLTYEDLPWYPLTFRNTKGKNWSDFDESEIKKFLIGGKGALDSRSIFNEAFTSLNKVVDLRTMNDLVRGGNKKEVRERLFKAMTNKPDANGLSLFRTVLDNDPYTRFKFKSFNNEDKSFVLTNEGVKWRVDRPNGTKHPAEIHFNADHVSKIIYLTK